MTEREPDVEIDARVKADELRFECKPTVDVIAHSNAPARAASVSERRNLPYELETGVTYRDVEVSWHAWARLEDPEDD